MGAAAKPGFVTNIRDNGGGRTELRPASLYKANGSVSAGLSSLSADLPVMPTANEAQAIRLSV